jgi:hypothetical protein
MTLDIMIVEEETFICFWTTNQEQVQKLKMRSLLYA